MISVDNNWTVTLVCATLAVAFALAGLGLNGIYPGAAPLVATGLLVASLGFTAAAFTRVALRVRRLELENEGLIEEISQEFDRVKDKIEIFSEALAEPRSITPEEIDNTPMRRVTIK
ncbi:MAG TPA: hypothetical protein VFH78_01835 [Candidatus Thermoplasmatota archaeon]|nr:hypothetical protein [Candidatus Thermoplasmatota archaeon]